MTGAWLLLLVGVVLIAAGVVAGAARVRTIGLAQGGRPLRIAATVAGAGLLFVVAALILFGTAVPTGRVSAVISDELASDQVSEQVTVFLDGRDVGSLKLDARSPKARLTVTVAKAGRHAYRLESVRQVKGHKPIRISSVGQVVIVGGSGLGVFSDDQGQTGLGPVG